LRLTAREQDRPVKLEWIGPHRHLQGRLARRQVALARRQIHPRVDKPGTYDYFCSFHPYMTGSVVVQTK